MRRKSRICFDYRVIGPLSCVKRWSKQRFLLTLRIRTHDPHSLQGNRLFSTLQDRHRSQTTADWQALHGLKSTLNRALADVNVRSSTPRSITDTSRAHEREALARQRIAEAKLGKPRSPLLNAQVSNDRSGSESLDDPDLELFEGKSDLWYDFKSTWDLLPSKSTKPLRRSGRPDLYEP